MSESRARKRIRLAVESRGFTLESLGWERPYNAGEMMGIGGGWTGTTVEQMRPNTYPGNEFDGLNVEDCLADIDWSMRPNEPCACERPQGFHPRGGVKGWPSQVGMHDKGCRWHISYHLTWWHEHGPDWSNWESKGSSWEESERQKPTCVCGFQGTPEECANARKAKS